MTSSRLETHRQTILHFLNEGVCNAQEIHKLTNIPLSTIKYNIKKLKENGNEKKRRLHQPQRGFSGQFIRRNPTQSLRNLAVKLSKYDVNISYVTIKRHLNELGYKNQLPIGTPMLTEAHKAKRVEWAKKHINDSWEKTLFSDETAFQLFRNTIKHWHKGQHPTKRFPKNRQKVFAWGGFSVRGKTSLFCFTQIMDAKFYVEILEKHLQEINRMLENNWRLQQDNDPKYTSHRAKEFLREMSQK